MRNKTKINYENSRDYVIGNIRHYIYYSRLWFLIRKHIREQFLYRIQVMSDDCYNNGNCKECGCITTNLQMSNRACEGKCYTKMMNEKEWEWFKENCDVTKLKYINKVNKYVESFGKRFRRS